MSGLVVFDLDGTLVDTAPDLVATLNSVVTREGMPPVPFDVARSMVGRGARRMIELAVRRAGRVYAAHDTDRMFNEFIAYYAAHIADHSKPFPGLTRALDQLSESGYRFAICTNKLEGLSRLLLDQLGLSGRFLAICGADTFGVQKPDPDILRRTIIQAGGRFEQALLVGDSVIDIETARAARVPVIAVDFGYTDTPVAQLGPDRVIAHFDMLPAAVRELFAIAGNR